METIFFEVQFGINDLFTNANLATKVAMGFSLFGLTITIAGLLIVSIVQFYNAYLLIAGKHPESTLTKNDIALIEQIWEEVEKLEERGDNGINSFFTVNGYTVNDGEVILIMKVNPERSTTTYMEQVDIILAKKFGQNRYGKLMQWVNYCNS